VLQDDLAEVAAEIIAVLEGADVPLDSLDPKVIGLWIAAEEGVVESAT
jgi:hypothetical protein